MSHQADSVPSPEGLSGSVVEAAQQLGLVRAEMGRILGFRCAEFTALYEGSQPLQPGTHAWEQGLLFARLHELLLHRFAADTVQMVHWLRRPNPRFGDSPFYLIVDQGRLGEVVANLVTTCDGQ